MSLVDTMFQEAPAAPAAAAPRAQERHADRRQPAVQDFSVDEMVAVIEGLKLLSFERGEVILREGDPGSSLYTLTSGRVRAFRKDTRGGKQLPLGDLKEGAFFGELSVLTGAPRTATVVALTRCELLELDRPDARRDHQDAPARLGRAARVREHTLCPALSRPACYRAVGTTASR